MRKLFALFAMISLLAAGTTSTTYAQDSAEEVSQTDESATQDKAEITQTLKEKFIEGGPFFMSFVLIALILGLALCIERIIFLNLSTQNTHKLLSDIESSLASGGIDEAKELQLTRKNYYANCSYR